jgi:uncharacterized Zn finger protein (UPF0148 family)
MWDCPKCGTGNITPGVEFCPTCQVPRPVPTTEASKVKSSAKDAKEDWGSGAKDK